MKDMKELLMKEVEQLRFSIAVFDEIFNVDDFDMKIKEGKIHVLSESDDLIHFFVKSRHCYGYTYIDDVVVQRIRDDEINIVLTTIDEVDVDKLVEMMVS